MKDKGKILGTRYTSSRQQIDAIFARNMSSRQKMPDYAFSYAGISSSLPDLPSVS